MTLGELKTYIAKLPKEMDEFSIVNGEVGYLEPDNEESLVYRVDKPIIALYVDQNSEEICFFHQTQEDVNKALTNGDTEKP